MTTAASQTRSLASQRGQLDPGELYLLVTSARGFSAHALPRRGRVRIGRTRDADIQIPDPAISRAHAAIEAGDRLSLVDLGSANGTRVCGRLIAEGEPVELRAGDVIELGETLVVIQRAARAGDPIAASGPMSRIHELIERVAPSGISVLIRGETGVGKEVCAERLHDASLRSDRPFLRINCAAISESLLESELFGHERGAFTGAVAAKPGLLETADGGTVLLDEIGDLAPPLQSKLLRVLEQRKVTRVGGIVARAVDLRFVSATHRDLESLVASGEFRSDLYYRIAGVTIEIPPLRERPDELEQLALRLAQDAAPRGARPVLSADALVALRGHGWPGNVRELRNVMTRAVAMAGGAPIAPEHLGLDGESGAAGDELLGGGDPRRRELMALLIRCGWNQTRAARELGIARGTLRARMNALDLKRPQS